MSQDDDQQDDFEVSETTADHSNNDLKKQRASLPNSIDRYQVIKRIGEGGFGEVFLADDPELGRKVAIKLIKTQRSGLPSEGKTNAKLKHEHIVQVYDTGEFEGALFFVFDFIEGCDLASRLKRDRISIDEAIRITKEIASALHYAHTRRVIHRDVKPANILIASDQKSYLADFGIALIKENLGRGSVSIGTPRYMSPEQARGDSHRVDGRSDVFSLGAVLFEMLTGEFAFDGSDKYEIVDCILNAPARPLRQIDDTVPLELERICLRALERKIGDRYQTAKDFADDLKAYPSSADVSIDTIELDHVSATNAAIEPKGLRSYDETDRDFFLQLLPNPRDRFGIPVSISSWKKRIEESDPEKSFRIGVIEGPSGCGKSSWMKAGLLPLLDSKTETIYLEADANSTARRLYERLTQTLKIDQTKKLDEIFADIRRETIPTRGKILVVIDQFEQWLNATPRDEMYDSGLAKALRQCDATHLQAIVMVRSDFWNSINLFMSDGVEERVIPGHNSSSLQLFDLDHSERVLALLGRAQGKIEAGDVSEDQRQFLKQAVNELSQESGVACIRLVLFAEIMKYKYWTPESLRDLGGLSGIGAKFLSEMFSHETSPSHYRYHADAALAVLEELLPPVESEIKGSAVAQSKLLEVSGYDRNESKFADLIRYLDQELRLIKLADPSEIERPEPSHKPEPSYRITHDYLVPAIRKWVEDEKTTTKKGRVELLLKRQAKAWEAKPVRKNLLSLLEVVDVARYAKGSARNEVERRLFSASAWSVCKRVISWGVVVAVISSLIYYTSARKTASDLTARLLSARIEKVPEIVEELDPYRSWVRQNLTEILMDTSAESKSRLHAAVALADEDDAAKDVLEERITTSDATTFRILSSRIGRINEARSERLWNLVEDGSAALAERFKSACVLANIESRFSPSSIPTEWDAYCELLSQQLVEAIRVNPDESDHWIDAMVPLKVQLAPFLERLILDSTANVLNRTASFRALIRFAGDDIPIELLAATDEEVFPGALDMINRDHLSASEIVDELIVVRLKSPKSGADVRTEANLIFLLWRALPESTELWTNLSNIGAPDLQTALYTRFGKTAIDGPTELANFNALARRIRQSSNDDLHENWILSLLAFQRIPDPQIKDVGDHLLKLLKASPDPGIHSACELVLERWGYETEIANVVQELFNGKPAKDCNWYYAKNYGHGFALLGPIEETKIGTDKSDPEFRPYEDPKTIAIERRFAIGFKEVTIDQFSHLNLKADFWEMAAPEWKVFVQDEDESIDSDRPQIFVQFHLAAKYCNWLSQQEGIPENQWCYDKNGTPHDDALLRDGYRLPTENEWEYACRAGSYTAYYFGNSRKWLAEHVWNYDTSEGRAWPVGQVIPNDFGLFDMLGNAAEWCHDEVEINGEMCRVLRGGSFGETGSFVRCATRDFKTRQQQKKYNRGHGFRIARTITEDAFRVE